MEETSAVEETSTIEAPEVRKYELMIIFSPEIGDKGRDNELEELRELISSNEGKIFYEDLWELRDLAFKIKKQEQGLYVVLDFELANPAFLDELEKTLILNQDVLRHLITKIAGNYTAVDFSVYEEEAEKEKAEREAEKEEKRQKSTGRSKPAPKKEKPVVKVEKPKKEEKKKEVVKEEKVEEVVEVAEEKSEKDAPAEEAKTKLSDVDKKLKSIIDDPDISL